MKYVITGMFISLLFFLIGTSHALVGPITPGQNLWCVNQRIGETTDTILEIVSSILDCACGFSPASSACAPIALVGLTISQPGNYCLANDISFGIISITANDVTLDLNNRTVNGQVSISGDRINLKNGFIVTFAANAGDYLPGINVSTNKGSITIANCVVDCSAGALGNTFSRNGIDVMGTSSLTTNEVRIVDCEIIAGGNLANYPAGTGISLTNVGNSQIINNNIVAGSGSDVDADGGDGIFLSNTLNTLIINNFVTGGNGGNGGNAGGGGNGGNGITLFNSGNSYAEIKNNIIAAGNGGSSTSSTAGTGGSGVFIDTNNQSNKIQFCTVSGGDIGLTGGSATGGDGVTIGQLGMPSPQFTEVSNCIIAKAGLGSAGGNDGYAVNDANQSATSVIFGNVAYNLANPSLHNYKLNTAVSPAGVVVTATGPVHGNYYFM